MKSGNIAAVLCSLVTWFATAGAEEFALRQDRVHMDIRHEPLVEFLQRFADLGVRVQWDGVQPHRVSGSAEGETLEKVLDAVLAPAGYALTWEVVEGPIPGVPRLVRLDVFTGARPDALTPLQRRMGRRIVQPVEGRPYVEGEILVAFRHGTTARDVERFMALIGGVSIEGVDGLGVYRIRIRPDANIPERLAAARGHPAILHAEPNYAWRGPAPVREGTGGAWPQGAGVQATGASLLAVMDSGFDPAHMERAGVSGVYDATQPERPMSDPTGHGTQMALVGSGLIPPQGLALLEGRDPTPVTVVKTFDEQGFTTNFDLMRGFRHALDEGNRVVNMSWGTEESTAFMDVAVRQAQESGLILVAAAGNEPHGRPLYPAAYPGVVAASAANSDGTPWDQSNYGPHVSVLVPGQAEFPVGHNGPAGLYAGTSISSAYVGHILASYLRDHPETSGEEAVQRLQASLTPNPAAGSGYGAGLLDDAAVRRFLLGEE